MNNYTFNKIKVNKYIREIKNKIFQKPYENQILKKKLNPHNVIESLNSEISFKIKDNIALDIFNNNANTLSFLLSKKKYNRTFIDKKNTSLKTEKKIFFESLGHQHSLTRPLNENDEIKNINNFIDDKINKINRTDNNSGNKRIFSINSYTYYSPYILKIKEKKEKPKKIDEVIINYTKDKNYENKQCKIEINDQIKKGKYLNNINKYSEKRHDLKNKENNEKIENKKNDLNQRVKIYKKKAIKNSYHSIKYEKSNHNTNTININESNGKKEKQKDENIILLNNYRKRMIKQFLFYLKPYYYSFIKNYFREFISNIKNIKKYNKISAIKGYNKKINKRNLYNNERLNDDLKLIQLNYSNFHFTNINNNNTENSNKIQSEKDFSNPYKKINYFLINNNNINFRTKENSKDKLYRNNLELEKKYIEIIKRKKRKKILINEIMNIDNSRTQIRKEKKIIEIPSYNNKNLSVNNSYEKLNDIYYFPYFKSFNNSILKYEVKKEDNIRLDKNKNVKIKTISKNQRDKHNIIKHVIYNNNKRGSPFYTKDKTLLLNKKDNKFYLRNKSIKIGKKNNKNLIITKRDKINNINNSHYNKNIISKTIKNIFTRDQKINIHINYVFYIPKKQKNKEKLNELLETSRNFSFSYIGSENHFNKNNKKIYSEKKLHSIKEEEEKSKCSISMSMILQNSKTVDEYNSIVNLITNINNYIIIKTKKKLFNKLKLFSLIVCIKKIIAKNIFKSLKLEKQKQKKRNSSLNVNLTKNNSNLYFLVDDKLLDN